MDRTCELPTARDHLADAAMDGLFYAVGGRIDGSYARNLAVIEAPSPIGGSSVHRCRRYVAASLRRGWIQNTGRRGRSTKRDVRPSGRLQCQEQQLEQLRPDADGAARPWCRRARTQQAVCDFRWTQALRLCLAGQRDLDPKNRRRNCMVGCRPRSSRRSGHQPRSCHPQWPQ